MPLKENFCSRPFNELHIEEDGKVTPCCVMPSNRFYFGKNLKEYIESKKLKEIKTSFLKGDYHPNCENCWSSEKLGITSHRKQDYHDLKNIKYIHLRLNNVCNFKCRMCNPKFSSSWEVENKKHQYFQVSSNTNKDIFSNSSYLFEFLKRNITEGKLEFINMSGGEPLITDAHEKLITFLINNKLTEINLAYSTNLSNLTYKKLDLLNLWSKFRHVTLEASCDGWGKAVEYSRTGFNLDIFKKNLIKTLNRKNMVTKIHCIVNIYSVWSLPTLLKIAKKLNVTVVFDPLYYPEFLNPQRLDRRHKKSLQSLYTDPILKSLYEKYINVDLPSMSKEAKDYNLMLDKYRDTNFYETFPMYKEYL